MRANAADRGRLASHRRQTLTGRACLVVALGFLLAGAIGEMRADPRRLGGVPTAAPPVPTMPAAPDQALIAPRPPVAVEAPGAVEAPKAVEAPGAVETPKAVESVKKTDEAPAERRLAFSMDGKPWGSVFSWLSEQTGKPVVTNFKPTGSFTFISPGKRLYTIPEVIDIINEALLSNTQTQKYYLIHRERNFTLVPADEKIDQALLPRISVAELTGRGRTELVSLVLPLKTLVAEDVGPEVKKMMGPFGEVVPLTRANQLLLQDTVANLQRIVRTLDDIEKNEGGQANQLTYECKWIKASEAERILKELMGDSKALLSSSTSSRDRDRSPPPSTPTKRMHFITSNERTNTVLITGPADKVAEAEAILKRIDIEQKGQKRVLVGPAELKIYNVAAGSADSIAKTLQEAYKASSTCRISTAGTSKVLVYATPEDQIEIAKQILGTGEKSDLKTETLGVGDLDPATVAKTLQAMFGGTGTAAIGAVYVEALPDRNAVLVRGNEDQLVEVRATLKAMGGEAASAASRFRVITLEGTSGSVLAEELARVLGQMRKNPVQVISPDNGTPRKEEAPPKKPAAPEGDSRLRMPGSTDLQPVSYQPGETGLVDPREGRGERNGKDALPGSADKPVRIFASGNRFLIASDDPDALALTQQVINFYTRSPGKGAFEVLKLKNANATEAAKALEEAFNGPKQNPQQGGGGGFPFGGMFGRFGAPGAAAPADPEANRIRVVAYPATNALLVRATPLDMLAIRNLLAKALDAEETDPRGQIKTWRVTLEYASASEVANVLREVYKDQTSSTPSSTTVGGFPGFLGRFGGGQPQASSGRASILSLGVDDRANALVLACPEVLYKDIKKLVDEMDEAAKGSTRTVKVVSVKGIDPQLVQQAIDAIQGRTTMPRRTTTGGGGGGASGTLPGSFRPTFPGVAPGGPGASGGFTPGGFAPGGRGTGGGRRGTGGGGGGGGGRRGGGMGDLRQPGGGSDFFAGRVTDDPRATQLYDPRQDNALQPVSYQEPAPKPPVPMPPSTTPPGTTPGAAAPAGSDSVVGPRSSVNVEPLEELGVIVISGNTPADVEAVVKIIDYLQKLGVAGDLEVRMVALKMGDATGISNYLTEFYRRVVVGPSGTSRATATARVGPGGQAIEELSSVVLLPFPRFNAILVAAPRVRLEEVLKQIKELDQPTRQEARATPFPLKRASASRVATLITNFFAGRYPTETSAQNQVRVTWDDSSNTIFVQASPADLTEIRELIERIDSSVSSTVNELRIVPIKNGLADEITTLILRAVSQGVQAATPTGGGIVPTLGGGLPGAGGALGGLLGGAATRAAQTAGLPLGGAAGAAGGLGGTTGLGLGAGATGAPGATGSAAKMASLRFISALRDGKIVEGGLLEDIRLTPDVRTNTILVSAPTKTMDLLLTLIKELDVPPATRAEINIFPLKKADATTMAATIQQLFLGTASIPTGATVGAVGGLGGGPGGGLGGALGGLGGIPGLGGAGAFPGTTGLLGGGGAGLGALRPLTLMLGGLAPEGAPLIDLRITVDTRTNSLIVAGSRNDLEVIEALISRLEDSNVQGRFNEVYRLVNTTAVDVANALNTFLQQSLSVYQRGGQLTQFQDLEREVVVVPEPITNKLLISATPRYYPDIMRLIAELDAELPQVVIQVLIAEVQLKNNEEFGVEIGLQSPVLFQRGVTPAAGQGGTVSYTNPNAALVAPFLPSFLVPAGVTVNSTVNPTAVPGFNFNQPALGLGNNPVVDPGIVGFQGLGSLGVGRVSPNSSIGGFVFSAASDSFNLLVRALKSQGRIDVLSRPQVMTLDNQAAQVAVGQSVPVILGSAVTVGIVQNNINYRDVGIILNVVPKISPDGKVTMRVTPQVSSMSPTLLDLGAGVRAPVFNQQIVDTTVIARDGETVAIGGLITRSDAKNENKFPWLGDLPVLGTLFRYRTQYKEKRELLVILTPHIVRNRMEAEKVLAEEGRRMDWVLGDAIKTHGMHGMHPLFPPPPAPPTGGIDAELPAPLAPGQAVPNGPMLPPPTPLAPGSEPVVPPVGTPLPPGAVVPGAVVPPPSAAPGPDLPAPRPVGAPDTSRPGGLMPAAAREAAGDPADRPLQKLSLLPGQSSTPAKPPVVPAVSNTPAVPRGKESERWSLFNRSR